MTDALLVELEKLAKILEGFAKQWTGCAPALEYEKNARTLRQAKAEIERLAALQGKSLADQLDGLGYAKVFNAIAEATHSPYAGAVGIRGWMNFIPEARAILASLSLRGGKGSTAVIPGRAAVQGTEALDPDSPHSAGKEWELYI
jgi:hypothetical protein